MNENAEILDKIYKYKKLILSGKIKINFDTAKKFVGPDVAYHLYKTDILKKIGQPI
ncbi:MAG: hypothetical protein JXB50_12695 [Spirochaetes bacterium]|nr:hypothetical protein [Spirochaetota bacterium]